jgi:hypothetical protein
VGKPVHFAVQHDSQVFHFRTTFSPHDVISRWFLYVSLFLINIGISDVLSLEISSL